MVLKEEDTSGKVNLGGISQARWLFNHHTATHSTLGKHPTDTDPHSDEMPGVDAGCPGHTENRKQEEEGDDAQGHAAPDRVLSGVSGAQLSPRARLLEAHRPPELAQSGPRSGRFGTAPCAQPPGRQL